MSKKYFLMIIIPILFLNNFSIAQFLTEDFDYAVGDSLTGHIWSRHSGTGSTILVQSGNLFYTDYPSSGIGNDIQLSGGSGSREDINTGLDTINSNGDVLYFSFLVKVNSAGNTADYFMHIGRRTSPTSFSSFAARVFIQNNSGNLRFGLSNSTTAIMGNTDFDYDSTYLVIVKYSINTSGADECNLWVFSSGLPLSETEAGQPEVTDVINNGQDIINAIALRQGSVSYSVVLDGIRVSTQWSDIVPVELISFSAKVDNRQVYLNWTTATETNNRGFEIERLKDYKIERLQNWEIIGFVPGYGTTTEQHNYSFIDKNITTGKYKYRLKQVDYDGTSMYSDAIEIEVTSTVSFELMQNYPNPFNPSTRIQYATGSKQFITLKIYNVLGNEIATLVNEEKPAGVYEAEFNGAGLSTGTYFYKLDAGRFSEVRKMILIK